MTRGDHTFDVVVLGAGPAGCAAAVLLARRAHRVALVRPKTPPAPALAESIPPSAWKVLEELGAADAVRDAGFHANRGNVVDWAGQKVRREDFATDVEGFHTDRQALEECLATVAERSGVVVFDETSCRSGSWRSNDLWELRCERGDEEVGLLAPWVVDATGRRGVLARAYRENDRSTTTLALVRRWRHPGGWDDDTAHHTVVESYETGWAWSVPLSLEVRCITAMIDQRSGELEGESVNRMLDAELDKTHRIGRLRSGAEAVGPAWACPASLYTSTRFAQPGLVVAGDAGSFIDPLSSFGVKKALSSGWLAGIVVHTALVDPAMASTAADFFHQREETVYRRYRALSRDFFTAGADAYGTPYWVDRATAARLAATDSVPPFGHVPSSADPDALEPVVPVSAVRAAFEALKARDTLRVERGSTVRPVRRPAVEGHRIVLKEHVASDAVPGGLRFVRGVDLSTLLEICPRHDDVADAWAAYNAVAPPVTLPDYLTALSTAFAAELLGFASSSGGDTG